MAIAIDIGSVEDDGRFYPLIAWKIEDNPKRIMKCEDSYATAEEAMERAEALARAYQRIAERLGYEDWHEVSYN